MTALPPGAWGSIHTGRARRVAVVGGGVSGLAAAHRLIELAETADVSLDVSLFEGGARLGGAIWTERIEDYIVELGADSFITNKPEALDLCRRLGLEGRLIATESEYRQALVLRKGVPRPVPDGFMLMAPARLWPVLTSPIFSPLGKLRLGLEYLVPHGPGESDESVASFVRRRFGREVLDRLVQPLVGGIYTADPEKLSLKATLPRFLDMEREHGSLIVGARRARDGSSRESGARYGMFASFEDGMSELVTALSKRVHARGKTETSRRVLALRRQSDDAATDSGVSLTVSSGTEKAESLDFDAVVLAVPTWCAAELLAPVDSALSSVLGEIEYASSAIVVSAHSLSEISHPLNASGLVIPAIENRPILSVSFASRKFAGRAPQGKVILRTFIGGAMQPAMLSQSDEELTRMVLAELRSILGVRGQPHFTMVSRHERSMPQYHVGHLERVGGIERLSSTHRWLALAGSAYAGVGVPDCVRNAEQAASRLWQHLSEQRTSGGDPPDGSGS